MNMTEMTEMTEEEKRKEEMNDLFESKSFKYERREDKELSKLYESAVMIIPQKGDVVSAKYVGISYGHHCFSVLGYKDDIRVDDKYSESKYLKSIIEGDSIEVLISKVDNDNFFISGSVAELYESNAHEDLKSLDDKSPIPAYIKSINPAGYVVELTHGNVVLPGFMPNTLAGINKLYDPNSIIGQTFDVLIESFSEYEGTYIVSRRKYLQTLIPEAVKELMYDVTYTGNVTGSTPFGVFVEFNGCLTGMIHKVNINPEWQDKMHQIKPGMEIDFYIKEVIKERGNSKIILTQILRETLWDTIKNGQIIDAKVKDVKPFGTLVILDEETVGLIHNSEVERLKKKFNSGDDIKVKVLSVDRSTRKIFLTAC